MSLINEVVFGSITIDLLKQTEIWKANQNEEGRIPSHILRGLLDLIGFDVQRTIKKEKPFSSFKAVVRDKLNPCNGYWTIVFSGKIKPSCPWIESFKQNDIVSELNLKALNIETFNLDSFGNDTQTWKKINGKKDKTLSSRYF